MKNRIKVSKIWTSTLSPVKILQQHGFPKRSFSSLAQLILFQPSKPVLLALCLPLVQHCSIVCPQPMQGCKLRQTGCPVLQSCSMWVLDWCALDSPYLHALLILPGRSEQRSVPRRQDRTGTCRLWFDL